MAIDFRGGGVLIKKDGCPWERLTLAPVAELYRNSRYQLHAATLRCGMGVMHRLGPVAASNVAGHVARVIGPTLSVSQVADTNLRLAMPELTATARQRVIRGVWENLGRTVGELPHLATLRRNSNGPGWECDDDKVLRDLGATGGPAILFSAHLANWEIGFPVAAQLGLSVSWFYRAASNPLSNQIIQNLRHNAAGTETLMFPKGAAGARAAFAHLRRGGLLGMLIDQKLNEGIAAPFFGHLAMTTSLPAQLALRFRCPVIPIHPIRLGAARFRIVCEPPLPLPDTADHQADVLALTTLMNATIERWIRAQPECWLWLHRRWPTPPSEAL